MHSWRRVSSPPRIYQKIDGCYIPCDILDDKIFSAVLQLTDLSNEPDANLRSLMESAKHAMPSKESRMDSTQKRVCFRTAERRKGRTHRKMDGTFHVRPVYITETDTDGGALAHQRKMVKSYTRKRSKRGRPAADVVTESDVGTDSEYDSGIANRRVTRQWRSGVAAICEPEVITKRGRGKSGRKTDAVDAGAESEPDIRQAWFPRRSLRRRAAQTDLESEMEDAVAKTVHHKYVTIADATDSEAVTCNEVEPGDAVPRKRGRGRPRKLLPITSKAVVVEPISHPPPMEKNTSGARPKKVVFVIEKEPSTEIATPAEGGAKTRRSRKAADPKSVAKPSPRSYNLRRGWESEPDAPAQKSFGKEPLVSKNSASATRRGRRPKNGDKLEMNFPSTIVNMEKAKNIVEGPPQPQHLKANDHVDAQTLDLDLNAPPIILPRKRGRPRKPRAEIISRTMPSHQVANTRKTNFGRLTTQENKRNLNAAIVDDATESTIETDGLSSRSPVHSESTPAEVIKEAAAIIAAKPKIIPISRHLFPIDFLGRLPDFRSLKYKQQCQGKSKSDEDVNGAKYGTQNEWLRRYSHCDVSDGPGSRYYTKVTECDTKARLASFKRLTTPFKPKLRRKPGHKRRTYTPVRQQPRSFTKLLLQSDEFCISGDQPSISPSALNRCLPSSIHAASAYNSIDSSDVSLPLRHRILDTALPSTSSTVPVPTLSIIDSEAPLHDRNGSQMPSPSTLRTGTDGKSEATPEPPELSTTSQSNTELIFNAKPSKSAQIIPNQSSAQCEMEENLSEKNPCESLVPNASTFTPVPPQTEREKSSVNEEVMSDDDSDIASPVYEPIVPGDIDTHIETERTVYGTLTPDHVVSLRSKEKPQSTIMQSSKTSTSELVSNTKNGEPLSISNEIPVVAKDACGNDTSIGGRATAKSKHPDRNTSPCRRIAATSLKKNEGKFPRSISVKKQQYFHATNFLYLDTRKGVPENGSGNDHKDQRLDKYGTPKLTISLASQKIKNTQTVGDRPPTKRSLIPEPAAKQPPAEAKRRKIHKTVRQAKSRASLLDDMPLARRRKIQPAQSNRESKKAKKFLSKKGPKTPSKQASNKDKANGKSKATERKSQPAQCSSSFTALKAVSNTSTIASFSSASGISYQCCSQHKYI